MESARHFLFMRYYSAFLTAMKNGVFDDNLNEVKLVINISLFFTYLRSFLKYCDRLIECRISRWLIWCINHFCTIIGSNFTFEKSFFQNLLQRKLQTDFRDTEFTLYRAWILSTHLGESQLLPQFTRTAGLSQTPLIGWTGNSPNIT